MSFFPRALVCNSYYFLRSRGSMCRRGRRLISRMMRNCPRRVEVTVQSKEQISIKGCCASLRDSDSHIPRCRVSTLYSCPPISLSPSPTAPCCQYFLLAVLIFLVFLFFSSTDISNAATDFAVQKIYMVYLVHRWFALVVSCRHHGPLKI